ncbi:alpha/beta-hydrolase [Fistulina hepatica ATCC 64428]|uniref:Carboxylic ester hydrolase n=1 Tax=Fistulina hepatica ATCC 64428 TaxID=1128425 RepID=A0A0D7A2P9_9AGAR|nr:alpha/beta-hydrolase [Fistulina hepatica ATCC 64428]
MSALKIPSTTDSSDEFTGEQLALPTSERVTATTKHGKVVGGRVRNGVQVFLNVPYAEDVPRWTDAKALPADYVYPSREYTIDGKYCAQPRRSADDQTPQRIKLGLGEPTDCPFFADIFVPSRYDLSAPASSRPLLPVKVFIHGGFLQFGSTSGFHHNQQQYRCEEYNEVRVLLGYRVSILGFLAAAKPVISGNYGFKDAWIGLQWVQDNIEAFGGDKNLVDLSGLSGGSHLVAQLLHHAARHCEKKAPFRTAMLLSNAILTNQPPPEVAQAQFECICLVLGLDTSRLDILNVLQDAEKVSTPKLIEAVENVGVMGTFRGVEAADGWVHEIVEFQRSGGLAAGLRKAGVTSVVISEVSEEWAFYQAVHPAKSVDELVPNLARYYPHAIAEKLVALYPFLPENPSPAAIDGLFGQIMADGQVYIPSRQLARDLVNAGFPTIRVQCRYLCDIWAKLGPYVQHGADLYLYHFRLSTLLPAEVIIATNLVKEIETERSRVESGEPSKPADMVLTLEGDGSLAWKRDARYEEYMAKEAAIRTV